MRVVITGMGGELGTRVAGLLEADDRIGSILGVDLDPPRRYLRRADFARVDPRDRPKMLRTIEAFAPTVLVHIGIYEPYARSSPKGATSRTSAGTVAAVDAAVEGGALRRIVMRSGIEVYGRGRHAPVRPDESDEPHPTSGFGRSLLHAERVCRHGAGRTGASFTSLRFAPIVGPHTPSPLGRLLRLPVVPVPLLGGGPFCLLHQEDAADALALAVHGGPDAPVNVVARGTVTPLGAVRAGGGVPVPVIGPGWAFAKVGTEIAGAPLPDHVIELFTHGRLADGDRVEEHLGWHPVHTTEEVVRQLHEWRRGDPRLTACTDRLAAATTMEACHPSSSLTAPRSPTRSTGRRTGPRC